MFSKPPLSYFKSFDLRDWPQDREQLASFGKDDISALVDHYMVILTEDEQTSIKAEWVALKSRISPRARNTRSGKDVLDVYTDILRIAPSNLDNIAILIKLMMTISVSTAVVERGFSALNRLKTSLRSTMSQECLRSHLMISINTPPVAEYNAADAAIQTWMDSGKGTRHVHGHNKD